MKRFEEELLKDDWTRVHPEVEVKKVAIPEGEETYILSRTGGRKEKERGCVIDLLSLIENDGLHHWYGEGVDWANNWVEESKQEFTDALSFTCVKCQCRTTISVPKGKPVTIGDVVCPVCKEVLLLTTFTALAK